MLGAATQTGIDGVRIENNAGTKTYTRVKVEDRVWAYKMYLYPIPQEDLFNNPNLAPQNPEWQGAN